MFHLFKEKGFKRYFQSINWLFLEKIARMVIAFAVTIYVARYLGAENLGTLNYSIVIVSLTGPLMNIGLDQVVYKKLIEKIIPQEQILGTALFLRLLAFIALAIFYFLILFSIQISQTEKMMILFIFAGHFFLNFGLLERYFLSNIQAKYIFVSSISSSLAFSAYRLVLVFLEMDLIYFSLSIGIELLIKSIFLIYFYFKDNNHITWSFNGALAKEMLGESWPFIFAGIANGLFMKMDQVMVKHMISNQAVGYYSIAVKITEIFYFIPVIISNSLFPAIMNAKKKSEEQFEKRLRQLYRLMMALSLIVSVFMFFISDILVALLFGDNFLEAVPVLKWYIWSSFFVFLGLATEKWMLANGLQKYSLANKVIAASVNIILNYFLIIEFGLIGAAIATFISYSIPVIFGPLIWKKTRKNASLIASSVFRQT